MSFSEDQKVVMDMQGVEVARVRNGVLVLSLHPVDNPQKAYMLAVEAALEHAANLCASGILVLAPGDAQFLREKGFSIAENVCFNPRLVPADSGKAMQLPRSRTATHRHDGSVWKRSRNKGWSRPLRIKYPVLGFWTEVNGVSETVWVHPAADGPLLVNGEDSAGWIELTDGDNVSYRGQEYKYLCEPPGRDALADFFCEFTASGWADPQYTRAFMSL
jgi:hypothetical protein